MTERLADITARIEGIQQLGAVVNAIRGIAAARAAHARNQLDAVDRYAATIATAIGRVLSLIPAAQHPDESRPANRPALVLFCAEQGFVGAFSERVLDAAGADPACSKVFLIGTRGSAIAAERGISADWHGAMPTHSIGVPNLADRIVEALYTHIATGGIDRLDAVFTQWQPGRASHVERRHLFPFDTAAFPRPTDANVPLHNLSSEALLGELTAAYLHAQLCYAALHAFAAENEARMEAMASAHHQIERERASLRATQRIVRQEEITAEIVELAAGEMASRSDWNRRIR